MIVVSDASPLLALAQADSLHLLKALFGRILIPSAVYRETVEQCPVPAQRQRIQSAVTDFISVLTTESAYRFSRNLGSGEQGVLALALERGADLLLMDDKKARNEASDLGFPCAYTTDILQLAEERGIIASAGEIVESLHGARIHLPLGPRN